MEDQTRSLSEVAGLMGVSERTVRRWIKAGRLKAYKPGRDYRIPEAGIRTFIEESEISPKVETPLQLEFEEQPGQTLDEGQRERERQVVYLVNDLIEEGEALEKDLKTSVEDWPMGGFYKFELGYRRHELLFEEISRSKQPSDELREAQERLNELYARVQTLVEQNMSPENGAQWNSYNKFARRRRDETLRQEEAAERTDTQDYRAQAK